MIPILLGSIYAPHGAAGFFFSNEGGGWEFPAFWVIALFSGSHSRPCSEIG